MQSTIIIIIVTLLVGVICLVDLWNRKCSFLRRLLWSPVPFIPFLGPLLYYALFEPPSVQKLDVPAPRNPIEQWKEWLNNRYNPGFFTGGQVHPVYQVTGSGVGVWFLASGITGLVFALFLLRSEGVGESIAMLILETGFSLIMIYAGLTRIAEGRKKASKNKKGKA